MAKIRCGFCRNYASTRYPCKVCGSKSGMAHSHGDACKICPELNSDDREVSKRHRMKWTSEGLVHFPQYHPVTDKYMIPAEFRHFGTICPDSHVHTHDGEGHEHDETTDE